MAVLEDLSAELIDLIASFIDCPNSFCNFREASRACYERTRTEFERRVCNLRFINAPHSLEVLRDISGDATLAAKIKALRLGVFCAGQDLHIDNLKSDAKYLCDPAERDSARAALARYRDYAAAAARFREGDDVAMMTLIMSRLPALDTIEIGEYRWHEGDDLRFYGLTTFEDDTGESYSAVNPPHIIDSDNGVDHFVHTFGGVLRAIRVSQKPIRHIRARQYDARWDYFTPLLLHRLPRLDGYFFSGLKDPLCGLLTLDLAISFGYSSHPMTLDREWLPKFLSLTPNLSTLTLTSDGYDGLRPGQIPQEEPCSALGFRGLAAVVHLPHLVSLSLELFGLYFADLVRFFLRHPHITDVKLRQVGLVGEGSWNDLMSQAFNICHLPATWNLTLAWAEQFVGFERGSEYVVFDGKNSQECNLCNQMATASVEDDFVTADCHHTTKTLLLQDLEGLNLCTANTQAMTKHYESWKKRSMGTELP